MAPFSYVINMSHCKIMNKNMLIDLLDKLSIYAFKLSFFFGALNGGPKWATISGPRAIEI